VFSDLKYGVSCSKGLMDSRKAPQEFEVMDLNDLVFYLGKVVPFWIIVEDGKMFGFGFEGGG